MSVAAPAIVVISERGLATARAVRDALGHGAIQGFGPRVRDVERSFEDVGAHLRKLFQDGIPIVGVCAAGILVRSLAPMLDDKRDEPPVLAVAEDGSAVVPILGGHRGGNDLARRIAAALGAHAAITTAGDLHFGVALDAPPPGWRVADPAAAKPVMAALLADQPVALRVEDGDPEWLRDSGIAFAEDAACTIVATVKRVRADDRTLVLHPAVLALGIGCERGVGAEEVIDLVGDTLSRAGLAPGAVACVVSLDLKSDEPAVHAAAEYLDVPARFFDAATLERETPRLANASDVVFREVGCHGVAEAAALAAAGPNATLIVEKRKSRRATCAVAQAPAIINAGAVGGARGRLAVIGTGPGAAAWRTAEAARELRNAEAVVGYDLYLDLIADLTAGKNLHAFALGEEEERVRHALMLAAEGQRVALVSSGDPGIYAMASLVFEVLEQADDPRMRRLDVTIVPGLSAMQAAAARVGAPLGHDFCAISLSDLLTPWPAIEARLQAAAEADFVIALYNPASRARRAPLERALAILRAARPTETPVIVARSLGRDAETIDVSTLANLSPDSIDMLTLLIIGSSQSRQVAGAGGTTWVYTPRGYATQSRDDDKSA